MSGPHRYTTRYRMAQNFGMLESDWELDAFSVALTPFKVVPRRDRQRSAVQRSSATITTLGCSEIFSHNKTCPFLC